MPCLDPKAPGEISVDGGAVERRGRVATTFCPAKNSMGGRAIHPIPPSRKLTAIATIANLFLIKLKPKRI